jgi:hypothetical protein
MINFPLGFVKIIIYFKLSGNISIFCFHLRIHPAHKYSHKIFQNCLRSFYTIDLEESSENKLICALPSDFPSEMQAERGFISAP